MMSNQKNLKILLWAPFGAGTHYWGPGTSAFRLYKENKNPSVQVCLIHASEEQAVFPEVYKEQIKLPSFKNKGVIAKLKYFAAAKKWIKKNHHKYDVVHALSAYEYTFRPMLEFVKYQTPVFIKIVSSPGGFGPGGKINRTLGLGKKRCEKANKINGYIAISSQIERNLLKVKIKKDKIHRIPNPVNIEQYYPVSYKKKLALRKKYKIPDKFTFLFTGGLSHRKRVLETLKGILPLIKEGKEIQLIIVGSDRSGGEVEEGLNEIIDKNNMKENIKHIPYVENPAPYYQLSDAYILASKNEGMSNSLLEAMATGLPAIVTDISGSQDLITENKTGLYTTGTPENIGEKYRWFLNHPQAIKNFGINARNLIEEKYSDKIILNKHIKMFNSIL